MGDMDPGECDISYGRYGGDLVKEEMMGDLGEEDEEEEEEISISTNNLSYIGQGLIDFTAVEDDDEVVPDHDPLSLEDEEDEVVVLSDDGRKQRQLEQEATLGGLVLPPADNEEEEDEIHPIEMKKIYSPAVLSLNLQVVQPPDSSMVLTSTTSSTGASIGLTFNNTPPQANLPTPELVFKQVEKDKPLKITSVASLHECIVGPSSSENVSSFPNLDIFRCFYCRLNYFQLDDLIRHRKSILPARGPGTHPNKTYDPELEKPFACGICGKPWSQPRKALACAKFGHDPQAIYWNVFRHDCPMCPERTVYRYHSLAAVARHWLVAHPLSPLPPFLLKDIKNDVLPTIKLSLRHFEMASGPLVDIVGGNPARALVIDNYSFDYCRKRTLEFPLILCKRSKVESEPTLGNGIPTGKPKAQKITKLRSYRCSECLLLVCPENEFHKHTCSRRKDGKIVFACPMCHARFMDKRTLKLHLMNFCACFSSPDLLNSEERFPYVCIICRMRFGTFQDLRLHRSRVHTEHPYEPDKELPFSCRICSRPAMIEKEAKLCEVFGHDPISIKKIMFKHKCGMCSVAFGFHSYFALKQHWLSMHSNLSLPKELNGILEEDVPLPSVTLTLEQLLTYTEKRKRTMQQKEAGVTEAIEDDICDHEIEFVKPAVVVENNVAVVEDGDIEVIHDSRLPNPSTSTGLVNASNAGTCELCGLTSKNLSRHILSHNDPRYAEGPKHKCMACGKMYYLKKNLFGHFKVNAECKSRHKYLSKPKGKIIEEVTLDESDDESNSNANAPEIVISKDKEENSKSILESALTSSGPMLSQTSVSSPPRPPLVLSPPPPPPPVFTSQQLDQAFSLMGDDFFGESAPVPASSETLTLHYGGNTDTTSPTRPLPPPRALSLQPPPPVVQKPVEFEAVKSKVITPPATFNFKEVHLDLDDIDDGKLVPTSSAADSHGLNIPSKKLKQKMLTKQKKSRRKTPHFENQTLKQRLIICTLCNVTCAGHSSFNVHMDIVHAEQFPFKCKFCGKRFDTKYKMKSHLVIHKPDRFQGEPKFSCEICGKKYHLETSMTTHRYHAHSGREKIKPRTSPHEPLLQPRPKWSRRPRSKMFPCQKCDRVFAYKNFLLQHMWRQHIGKFENVSNVRIKSENLEGEKTTTLTQVTSRGRSEPGKHTCETCKKQFAYPHLLRYHIMIHTGEKPHECSVCGDAFRSRVSLKKHAIRTNHHTVGLPPPRGQKAPNQNQNQPKPTQPQPQEKIECIDQAKEFKCIVCGMLFQWATDLRKHRIIKHGNFPSDNECTKPFGCGVCGKPYLRRSQAIICAVLEHDPASLLEAMFKEKCTECADSAFGFHSLSALRRHWILSHSDKKMPEELVVEVEAEENEVLSLPSVVVDEEKVKEIMEKGVAVGRLGYSLYTEFDLLTPPKSNIPEPALPPPIRIRPTPPIRIKSTHSQRRTEAIVKEEKEESQGLNLDLNINSVMSLGESFTPPMSPGLYSDQEYAEIEVEDVKPFIQYFPDEQPMEDLLSSSLHSEFLKSSIPNDNNIDINEGIPHEFQIRRTSARVSKLKATKSQSPIPGKKPDSGSRSSNDNAKNNQKGTGKETDQISKAKSKPVAKPKAKLPTLATAVSKSKTNATPAPSEPVCPPKPKTGKVQQKKRKTKPKSRKTLKAKPKQSMINLDSGNTHGLGEYFELPVITPEMADFALRALHIPPRLVPEIVPEQSASSSKSKSDNLNLKAPQLEPEVCNTKGGETNKQVASPVEQLKPEVSKTTEKVLPVEDNNKRKTLPLKSQVGKEKEVVQSKPGKRKTASLASLDSKIAPEKVPSSLEPPLEDKVSPPVKTMTAVAKKRTTPLKKVSEKVNPLPTETDTTPLKISGTQALDLPVSSGRNKTSSILEKKSVPLAEPQCSQTKDSLIEPKSSKGPAILSLLHQRRGSQTSTVTTSTLNEEQLTENEKKTEQNAITTEASSILTSASPNTPCTVNIKNKDAVKNLLGSKNLAIQLKRVDQKEINERDKKIKSASGSGCVSAFALQLREKRKASSKASTAASSKTTNVTK